MGIKVHGVTFSGPTMRVLACLNEKELDYEFVLVNMKAREHKNDSFLSLNPFGEVPAVEDGDLKLFESRAITHYIAHAYADKGTPLVSPDLKKMAVETVWMEVEAQHFYLPSSKLTWELAVKQLLGKPTDDAVVEEYEPQLAKVLDVYEARLTQSKYLGGDSFSLADLNHLPSISYLMATRAGALFKERPHVNAWCKDIMARPAWKKAFAMKDNK